MCAYTRVLRRRRIYFTRSVNRDRRRRHHLARNHPYDVNNERVRENYRLPRPERFISFGITIVRTATSTRGNGFSGTRVVVAAWRFRAGGYCSPARTIAFDRRTPLIRSRTVEWTTTPGPVSDGRRPTYGFLSDPTMYVADPKRVCREST